MSTDLLRNLLKEAVTFSEESGIDHTKNPFHKTLDKHGYEHVSGDVTGLGVGETHQYEHPSGTHAKVSHIGPEKVWQHTSGKYGEKYGQTIKSLDQHLSKVHGVKEANDFQFSVPDDPAPTDLSDEEIPGNDQPEMCPLCHKEHAPTVPCPKKKLLFGDDESGLKESKHKQKFDQKAHVRAIARNTVGTVPPRSVFTSKKDKPAKHKVDYRKFDEAEIMKESSYEDAKKMQDNLEAEVRKHSSKLKSHPKTGPFGMTSDDVRATPEWQTDKRNYDTAFKRLQDYNSKFTKQYAKEIQANRKFK